MNTTQILYSAGVILVTAGILLLAKTFYARVAAYDLDHELTEADNPAVGTALFGYLAGIVIVLAALLSTEPLETEGDSGMVNDLIELIAYGILAICLLKLAGFVNDRFILHRFENKKELVDDRNVGAGAVLCGSYLASGLVIAGALAGRMDGEIFGTEATQMEVVAQELGVALTFFVLGQIVLVIFGYVYQAVQKQDVLDAIEQDYEVNGVKHGGNAAAGIAFGASLTAVGLVLFGASRSDFTGWGDNLLTFGVSAGLALVLLPVWRIFVDRVMLQKADLAKEIYEDKNVNAALIEGVSLLGLAVFLLFAV
ncbi:MAG: DUF350 domain-containing protein [Myxococcota bacterium]|nr:DUF350 domain-containing protein [Myxococcota bacterium]